MPDEPTEGPDRAADRVFSGFGIASAVIAVIAAGAMVLGGLIWSAHHSEVDERRYQTEVLQTAADWTAVLVNMNDSNIDASLRRLQEGTVGQLNVDFEAVIEPYRRLVHKLQSRSRGQVDSVAIESLYHDLSVGDDAPPRVPTQQPELSELAARTDTVLVVATSVSANAGDETPRTVRWNLRLGLSNVGDQILVSRLETIR